MTEHKKLDIQREAICLSIRLGALGTRRRVGSGAVQSDANPEMLHVSKDILKSDELQAVRQHHGAVKRYLRDICLPSPFRHGVYLLPVRLIEQTLKTLDKMKEDEQALIDDFVKVYRIKAEAARAQLGSLYNPHDYPSVVQVQAAFTFDVQLWELSTPGSLRAIDRLLYEREVAKMDNVWEEAKRTVSAVLLTEMRKFTGRLAECLTTDADGKPKIFRDSAVGNFQAWLDLFDKRDLTDDVELKALAKQARDLIGGMKAETIRESGTLRAELSASMKSLTAVLDKAIEVRPRRIRFEDEEGE